MTAAILLCGNDDMLLDTRRMVLSSAGFLASICSEDSIASMPHEPAIALAVMGHSMPRAKQVETAAVVRQRWPEARILFLTVADGPLVKILPNEYESGSVNPSHLIEACREILNDG